MNNLNDPIKITIAYNGTRQPLLEEKIKMVAEKNGGNLAGEWGYQEKGFQCLFRFKRQKFFETFKQELNRELSQGYGFQKLTFGLG